MTPDTKTHVTVPLAPLLPALYLTPRSHGTDVAEDARGGSGPEGPARTQGLSPGMSHAGSAHTHSGAQGGDGAAGGGDKGGEGVARGGGALMDAELGAMLTSVGGVDDLPCGAVAARRAALAATAARLWSCLCPLHSRPSYSLARRALWLWLSRVPSLVRALACLRALCANCHVHQEESVRHKEESIRHKTGVCQMLTCPCMRTHAAGVRMHGSYMTYLPAACVRMHGSYMTYLAHLAHLASLAYRVSRPVQRQSPRSMSIQAQIISMCICKVTYVYM